MTLRELQYLVALADYRNFGRAAEACLISQPTLSTQIRKLEETLGVVLIERTPRNIMLTPAGEKAVERARRILDEMEQMREELRRDRDDMAGTVRLGAFPTLGPYLLPHVLAGIQAQFPQMHLQLVEEKSPALLKMLHAGKLDAAMLAFPVNDGRLHQQFLFDEYFLLAVPFTHPLAAKAKIVMDDLADHPLMLLEDGHCLRDQALDVCRMAGAQEEHGFRATSLETLRQMVIAGSGITLLPELAARIPYSGQDNLQIISFANNPPQRSIGLFWRKSSAINKILIKLGNVVSAEAQNILHKISSKK